jgi:hypothetical protein
MENDLLKYYNDMTGQQRAKLTFLMASFFGLIQFLFIYPVPEHLHKNWGTGIGISVSFYVGVLLIELLLLVGIFHHLCGLVVFSAKRNKYEARCIQKCRTESQASNDGIFISLNKQNEKLMFLSDLTSIIAMWAGVLLIVLMGIAKWLLGEKIIGQSNLFYFLFGASVLAEIVLVVRYSHELLKRKKYADCFKKILQGTEELNAMKIAIGLSKFSRAVTKEELVGWFGSSITNVSQIDEAIKFRAER